jgi:hypothetical protein
MSKTIDAGTREDLELLANQKLPEAEWPLVRQCLRCLTQGKKVAQVRGRKKVVKDPGDPGMDTRAAVRAVARLVRSKGLSVLAAARSLVFADSE